MISDPTATKPRTWAKTNQVCLARTCLQVNKQINNDTLPILLAFSLLVLALCAARQTYSSKRIKRTGEGEKTRQRRRESAGRANRCNCCRPHGRGRARKEGKLRGIVLTLRACRSCQTCHTRLPGHVFSHSKNLMLWLRVRSFFPGRAAQQNDGCAVLEETT